MKVVAVLFALVAVCRASGIGLSTVQVNAAPVGIIGAPGLIGLNGLGYGGIGLAGPIGLASPLGLSAVQVNAAPIGLGLAHAAPIAVAAAPAGAVSVNANRGSVHVAPLPGHIVGSKQLNLSPAPGTW